MAQGLVLAETIQPARRHPHNDEPAEFYRAQNFSLASEGTAQTVEYRRVGRIHGDDTGRGRTAAGDVKPVACAWRQAGAQAVGLRLQDPALMIRRPGKR